MGPMTGRKVLFNKWGALGEGKGFGYSTEESEGEFLQFAPPAGPESESTALIMDNDGKVHDQSLAKMRFKQ